jgi:hypothetical protein
MADSKFLISFKDLNLNILQIEEILGYKEGDDRTFVTELIKEILAEAEAICNIKAQYIICQDIEFKIADKSLTVNGINFQIGQIVFGQIKKSESVAVFLCTAGEEIGKISRKAMYEGDPLRGYIYDIAGSMIAEAASDLLQNELEKAVATSGSKITNRYSPGYCGWNVVEQHKLFQLIPDNFCGISLTESALMDPVKSVSGIIGIGEKVKFNPYTCKMCDMKDCIYRKVREKKSKK